MALYECVLIARQDISSSQAEGLVDQFAEIVENNGGKVAKKEMWGLRTLAYRIKKNRKGHYALLNLDAPPPAVAEMERNMRINEDVIRYLTLRVDELEAGPSVVLQARERRDDRGGRDGGRFGRGGPRGDRGDRGDRGHRGDRGPRGDRAEPRGDRAEPRGDRAEPPGARGKEESPE